MRIAFPNGHISATTCSVCAWCSAGRRLPMSQPFQSQPLPRSTRQSQLGAAVLHKLKSPDQPTPNYSDRISDRVVDKKSKRQGTSKSKTAEASSSQGSPSTKGRPLWGKFRAAQQKSSNKNAEASSPGAGASGLNSSQGEGVDGDTSYDPLDMCVGLGFENEISSRAHATAHSHNSLSQERYIQPWPFSPTQELAHTETPHRAQSSSQDATTGPRGDQDEEEDSSGDDMLPDPVSIAVKGNWLPSPQGATAQSDVLNQADSSVELMSMAHAHAADAEHPASSARPPPRIFSQQSSGMIPMKRVSDSIRNPRKAPTRALSKTSSSSSNPDRPGSSQYVGLACHFALYRQSTSDPSRRISDRSLPSIPSLPVAAAKRFSLAHKPSQDSSDGGLPPPIDLGWLPDQTARAPTAASTASRKVSTKMQGKRRGDCVSSTPATASPSLATPRVSPSIGTAPSGEAIIKITSSAVGAARAPRSATPKRKREHSEKASRQSAAKQVPSSSARGKGKPNLRSATATPAKAETLAQSSKDVKGKRRAPTIDESEAEEEDEDIDEDFEVSGTADPSMTQDPLLSRGKVTNSIRVRMRADLSHLMLSRVRHQHPAMSLLRPSLAAASFRPTASHDRRAQAKSQRPPAPFLLESSRAVRALCRVQ